MSLIEILVALGLSLIIMGGAITLLSSNKRVYKEQNEMGRLQENARFAMEILIKDIRMAGYAGCVDDIGKVQNHVNNSTNDDNVFSMGNAVEGFNNAGTQWKPSDSTDQVSTFTADTDGITIRYLDPNGMSPTDKMPTTSEANISVTSFGDLAEGDIIGVADCESAEVFEITGFASGKITHNTGAHNPWFGNATKVLQKRYGSDAFIVRFIAHRYYIRDNANGVASLYRQEANGTILELIEGVDNMQILFGEDTTNDAIADQYVNAASVGASNWDNVVSVKIALLINSVDENFLGNQDTTTYTLLDDSSVGPFNDYRRRKIFSNTVQIRNRSN